MNFMASNLTKQVRGIVKVVTAVANGDLIQKFVLEAKGEVAALAETINNMTDTLRIFADQVTTRGSRGRYRRKAGRGRPRCPASPASGRISPTTSTSWPSNLTKQVRGIVKVVTAVANGDLDAEVRARSEGRGRRARRDDQQHDRHAAHLRRSGDHRRARGRYRGQARRTGERARRAGTWRDLTDNVNQLAGNLTSQVRAIAEVSTAVAKGDLTRSITVEAQGEVAALKDNINQMIGNLKDTTHKNQEQDWLKTNLARFSGMMQGQRNIVSVAQLIMSELTPLVDAQHGAFYMLKTSRRRTAFCSSSRATGSAAARTSRAATR